MKWIYAELRNVNDRPLASYKINPAFIVAVDLNEQKLIIKELEHPLYYCKEDEPQIINLINGENN